MEGIYLRHLGETFTVKIQPSITKCIRLKLAFINIILFAVATKQNEIKEKSTSPSG